MSYRINTFRKKIEVLSRLTVLFQVVAGLSILAFFGFFVYHAKVQSDIAKAQLLITLLQKERESVLGIGPAKLGADGRPEPVNLSSSKEISAKLAKLSELLKNTKTLRDLKGGSTGSKTTKSAGIGGAELGINAQQTGVLANSQETLNSLTMITELISKLPLAVPAEAPLNSKFGPRKSPFSGDMKFHQGIDLAAAKGSPVYATGSGVVEKVGYNKTYGLCIDVRHSETVVSRFAHLSKALVKPGQVVSRGQELGKVGATGRATGPHLHYEIRVNEKAVDPAQLLKIADQMKEVL